jgi:sugar fermentation stimulation protein A
MGVRYHAAHREWWAHAPFVGGWPPGLVECDLRRRVEYVPPRRDAWWEVEGPGCVGRVVAGVIPELAGYAQMRREVAYGEEASRVDLVLEGGRRKACYVEVKNVTAAVKNGVALFPDCVSERGARHLRELMRLKAAGLRPVQLYCVQRGDVNEVRPADDIDAEYGRTLREAIGAGVEVLAYRARVSPDEIRLETRIPVVCP